MLHVVNLCTIIDPPLPECSFGNLYRIAMSMPTMETLDECGGLVRQMRETIKNIGGDYVKMLEKGKRALELY